MARGTTARLGSVASIAAIVAALALGVGAPAGSAHGRASRDRRAHAAIVNGAAVSSLSQAPWTAVIGGVNSESYFSCDGSVLDSTHILTAAHCLVDPATDAALAPGDLVVYVGLTNLNDISSGTPLYRVASTRVDPGYDPTGTSNAGIVDAYDLGVITLATPLTLGAGGPEAIALAPNPPAPGSSASVAGFGVETAAATETTNPTGLLNELDFTFAPAGECVPYYDAVVGCMSSSTGSACFGDSGSAVTTTSGTPMVVGVVDAGLPDASGNNCEPGSTTLVAKVSVPEIEDFIDGVPDPDPPAPQDQGDEACSPADPVVGQAITCYPGTWSGSPSLTYEFVDDATGAVLSQGSTSYTPTQADVGRLIDFVVSATNAGGTAYSRVGEDSAVQPPFVTTTSSTTTTATTTSTAPKPKTKPAALHLAVTPARVHRGGRLGVRVTLDSGSSALSQARVCVAVPARASVSTANGARVKDGEACWTVSLRANSSRLLALVLRTSRGGKRGTLTVSAKAGVSAGHDVTAQARVTVT